MASSTRPYSVRDLRSTFARSEMEQLRGDYEHRSRRWRFPSRDSASEARELLATKPEPVVVAIPGLEAHYPIVKANSGFLPSVRRFEADPKADPHKLFPPNLALFPDHDSAQSATIALYGALQATPAERREALTALHSADPRWFAGAIDSLKAGVDTLCWQHQAHEIAARTQAGHALRAPDAKAEADSISDVCGERQAQYVMRHVLHLEFTTFKPKQPTGDVAGILVGVSKYHLAILSDVDGNGHIVARDSVKFPLRRDGVGERSPARGSSILLEHHQSGAWTAFQDMLGHAPDWEKDLELGPLYQRARRAAGALLPILEVDWTNEDFDGRIIAVGPSTLSAIDNGATITTCAKSIAPVAKVDARIQLGPSFSTLTPALAHGTRR